MDEREKNDIKRRVEAWRVAGEFLQEERWARLRAMTDEDTRRAVVDLLSGPYPDLPERGSGLVEQQLLFKKLR